MSSFNIDDASGDEMRNLSVQWNYAASSVASNRQSAQHRQREREREPVSMSQTLKTFANAVCMIAGAATTVAVIGFATGWIRIEDIQRIVQS